MNISHPEFPRTTRSRPLIVAIGALLAVWVGMSPIPALADGPIRVGLYVQFEDGSSFTQCVKLDTSEATGLDVLRQAGLDLIFEAGGGMGTTVCKIGEIGCNYPGEDCFCQCLGSSCQYWTYWYEAEGQWKYSPLGVSNRVVNDGDVEGWLWGSGRESPPEEVLVEGICSASATATLSLLEEAPAEDSSPPPTRGSTAATPTQSVSRAEPETGSASPQPQIPLPTPIDLPTSVSPTLAGASPPDGGFPAFVWLIIGLSGLGILLLGLAYFVTRGRP